MPAPRTGARTTPGPRPAPRNGTTRLPRGRFRVRDRDAGALLGLLAECASGLRCRLRLRLRCRLDPCRRFGARLRRGVEIADEGSEQGAAARTSVRSTASPACSSAGPAWRAVRWDCTMLMCVRASCVELCFRPQNHQIGAGFEGSLAEIAMEAEPIEPGQADGRDPRSHVAARPRPSEHEHEEGARESLNSMIVEVSLLPRFRIRFFESRTPGSSPSTWAQRPGRRPRWRDEAPLGRWSWAKRARS